MQKMTNSTRPTAVVNESGNEVGDEDQISLSQKTYARRWFVLAVMFIAIALRGYNQSCFGGINNIYSKYFDVASWQVDWLVLTQSVVFILSALPLSLLIKKISYRSVLLILTFTLALGFILTGCGLLTRQGFGIAIFGQAIEGFSNVVSWALPPATAAIWFSSNEVATAVAVQVVARGVGEAAGCIVPPYIVSMDMTAEQTEMNLLLMFVGLAATAIAMFICCLFIKSHPPTPPSKAQANVIQQRMKEKNVDLRKSLTELWVLSKTLFQSPTFAIVWFTFGTVNPVLRTNNVLLSSMMHQRFDKQGDIDKHVGIVLAVAWSVYTVGGFLIGPVITKTHRYKELVTASVVLLCLACVVVVVGVATGNSYVVYVGVIGQGLFLGMSNTALFEIIAEITYPAPLTFVTMLFMVALGSFRLIYPIVGRWLLEAVSVVAATSVPVVTLLLTSILLLFTKSEYKRQIANSDGEHEILVSSSRDSNE